MLFSISVLIVVLSAFLSLFVLSVASKSSGAKVVAAVLAVVVSGAGFFSYVTHREVMGRPVEMQWSELPSEITVFFFRIEGEDNIILWLDPDQLVSLPYDNKAEEALEAEREGMGEGTPATFGEGEGDGGEGQEGEGEGEGGEGEGDEGEGEGNGPRGWRYELKSNGSQVVPGTLPPK